MKYQLYWGDIHNHCDISYAFGTLESAFEKAKDQLDFCSVTGHAFWPDMPKEPRSIVELCTRGYSKLQRNWRDIQKAFEKYNEPGSFITFLSYEWQSTKNVDHCVYYKGSEGPLVNAGTLQELQENVKKLSGLVIPHHIAYPKGYRGIDWACFDESISPFVEIYSMHGCSESDTAPYPLLHQQPREYETTAEFGLEKGLKFGFVASTDSHSGYPGSWGDGRMAVYAKELTRDAIWDAFLSRRTYAATGDKIKAQFYVNGAMLGEEISGNTEREIELAVETCDFLNKIEVVKNGRVIRCFTGDESPPELDNYVRAKLRIEWGWGSKQDVVRWDGEVSISDGRVLSTETCFSGMHILDPENHILTEGKEPLSHELLSKSEKGCAWYSHTVGNPTIRQQTTQALILEVEMPLEAKIRLEVNGNHYEHQLRSLLRGSRAHSMRGVLTEAIRIHKAIPMHSYSFRASFLDNKPERDVDYYYLRISQKNNQWAWVSPIWVSR